MIKKAYVDIDAGQVHYRRRAGEGTPIFFFHQTASSSAMFEAMMERFPEGPPLYAFDTPGFGGSFDPPGAPTPKDYADYLLQAVDALGLSKAHMFGHHTGACLVVEMAAARPGLVASAMMVGPVILTPEERQAFKAVYPKTAFEPQADGSHLAAMWEYTGELGAKDLALRHRETVDTARAWRGHMQVYSTLWDQDFAALFAALTCPTLAMCAPDDILWPMFERVEATLPSAETVAIDGSNFEPDEAPQPIIDAMQAFLAEINA